MKRHGFPCAFALALCTLLLAGCTVRLPPTPTPTRTPGPAVAAASTPVTTPATTAAALPTALAPAAAVTAGTQLTAIFPTPTPLSPALAENLPPAAASVAVVPTIARERPGATEPEPVETTPAPPAAAPGDPALLPSAAVLAATVAPPGEPAPIEAPAEAGAQEEDVQPVQAQPGIGDGAAILAGLPPSPLEGDLDAAYPALLDTPRFLLHYTAGSRTAADPPAATARVQSALEHLERLFGRGLAGGFDVYAAGSLFAPPDQALRGRSFSALRRLFVLQDGSGAAWDQQYIIGHELTHLYLWNAVGAPSSVMLSEGAAVYAASKLVEGQGPLPLPHICLAYARAGALPDVAGDLSYQGHIRDLENYYAAGCFVQYLVETYGVDAFAQLYPTGDYWGVYGQSLAALAGQWQAQLLALPDALPFDPLAFVAAAGRITGGYRDLFVAYGDTPVERERYAQLDRARTELLAGRFE